jgi:hypothetical protein
MTSIRTYAGLAREISPRCSRSHEAVICITAIYGEQRYFFSRTVSTKTKEGDGLVYTAFKQLENGEFVRVASRDELEEALQLVESLNAVWPGGYEVRESHSQTVRYATHFSVGRKLNREMLVGRPRSELYNWN